MGYFGRIVTARSAESLAGQAALGGAQVLQETTFGAWRSAQLDGDPAGALAALVAQTGAPALSAYIVDSDLADVRAQSPAGNDWRTYLHPAMAEDYHAPELPETADEVVRLALAWSAEAGLTADRDALVTVLEAENTFAEDTYAELLDALGVTRG
jgi:hypothetical protein